MTTSTRATVLFVILYGLGLARAVLTPNLLDGIHQKFEFENSFKPPTLINAKGEIPFWERAGDALATEDQVRVCPSMQDRYGYLWNKIQYEQKHWMMDVTFKISGRSTYGADGIAFWFTKQKGSFGRLFGNQENFEGLGIIVDTFDNNGNGDTPKVGIYTSNGNFRYNFATDGVGQDKGHCLKELRNRKQPIKMKVVYLRQTLQVWIHDGNSNIDDDYDLCAQTSNVAEVPSVGYFGISAATGGLSDDHDVLSFVIHTLTPLDELREKKLNEIDANREKELKEQYSKMSHDFQEKRDLYSKKHPKPGAEWQDKLETEETVRMIHSMQSAVLQDIRQLTTKLDGMSGSQGGGSDRELLQVESRLSHLIKDMKSSESGGKIDSQQMQPVYEMKAHIEKLKNSMETLQRDINKLSSKQCPQVGSDGGHGLSTTYFTVFMIVQWITIIGFLVVKHNQERNAKKFF